MTTPTRFLQDFDLIVVEEPVLKANPYHDREGKFTTKEKAIELVDVGSLRLEKPLPASNLARYEAEIKSGKFVPIQVSENDDPVGPNQIVDGHHRYAAALRLGLTQVPIQRSGKVYASYEVWATQDLPRAIAVDTSPLEGLPAYQFFTREASKWTKGVDVEARQNAFDYAQRDVPELGQALRKTYFGVSDDQLPDNVTVYRVGTGHGVTSFFPRRAQAEAYQKRMGVESIREVTFDPRDLVPSESGSGEVWGDIDEALTRKANPYHDKEGKFTSKDKAVDLFHATDSKSADIILQSAFKASKGGMYGDGVYLAPSLDEVTQYGDTIIQVTLKPDVKIKEFLSETEYMEFAGGTRVAERVAQLQKEGATEELRIDTIVNDLLQEDGFKAHAVQRQRSKYVVVHKPEYIASVTIKKADTLVFYLVEAPKKRQKADKTGRFVTPFVSFDRQGEAHLQLIASLNASRLATWGFTAECYVRGISRYKLSAILDGRTSEICKELHGKEFDVTDARTKVVQVLTVQDPSDLKTVQPWPKSTKAGLAELEAMSNDDLVARGFHIPPFHPGCRTICQTVGSDEASDPVTPATPTPQDQTITLETMEELGINATAEMVDQWNAAMGIGPVQVLSSLLGQSPAEILANPKANTIRFGTDGTIGIAGRGVMGDVKYAAGTVIDPLTRTYYLTEADLVVGSTEGTADFLRHLYTGLVTIGQSAGMKSVVVNAAGNALTYVQMGFLPTPDAWQVMRLQMLEEITPHLPKLSEVQRRVVVDLLNNVHEQSLAVLVDLNATISGVALGEWLLQDVSGLFKLNLTDPQTIAQIQGFLGIVQKANPYHDKEGKFTTKDQALQAWFGDSKVVDDAGKPLVVYHGTSQNFDTFEKAGTLKDWDAGYSGRGFYFGDASTGNVYAGDKPGANVIPAYLKMERPLRVQEVRGGDDQIIKIAKLLEVPLPDEANGINVKRLKPTISDDISAALREKGYDGVIYTWDKRSGAAVEYMVLDAHQIKSATGNRTFDPTSRVITKANPYHAEDGKFTTKDRAVDGGEDLINALEDLHPSKVFTNVAFIKKIPADKRRPEHLKALEYADKIKGDVVIVEDVTPRFLAVQTPEVLALPLLPQGLGLVQVNEHGTPVMDSVSAYYTLNPRTRTAMTPMQAEYWMTAREQALSMGFDPDRISMSEYERGFEVGGQKFMEGGHYTPESGLVTINSLSLDKHYDAETPQRLKALVAHEITHDAFNEVYRKPMDRLLEDATPEVYKFVDTLTKQEGVLASKDGVTEYSKAYWTAYYESSVLTNRNAAINETLAEISMLKTLRGYVPSNVSPEWKVLHEQMIKAYEAERKRRG